MKNNIRKFIKYFGLVFVVLVILLIGTYLYLGNKFFLFFGSDSYLNNNIKINSDKERVTIAYAFTPATFDPVLFDSTARSRMLDVYESLVKTDENLIIRPCLASTWGLIDELTWEFVIRKNVKFHDGRDLTVNDVVFSFERAKNDNISDLKSLLENIDSIEVVDDFVIRVKTKYPDPLLLSKIATVYISPFDYEDFLNPIGTGGYRVEMFDGVDLYLDRFDDYWGGMPSFKNVVVKTITDRDERVMALERGEIDFLVNMPPNYACSFFENYADYSGCKSLSNKNIVVKSISGLEVGFIAFNLNNNILKDKNYRLAIKKSLDLERFRILAYGFAPPARQFVASGVFGFNPNIKSEDYDIEGAKKLLVKNENDFLRKKLVFDYPESLPPLGLYVQNQLKELNIDVELNPLSDFELSKLIKAGVSDFYYMGWRSELGDASDFILANIFNSDHGNGKAIFNGMNYNNSSLNNLIVEAQKNLDTSSRLEQLQHVMKVITEDDVVGVPLFESEDLYGYFDYLEFLPRIDGYVYPSNIN